MPSSDETELGSEGQQYGPSSDALIRLQIDNSAPLEPIFTTGQQTHENLGYGCKQVGSWPSNLCVSLISVTIACWNSGQSYPGCRLVASRLEGITIQSGVSHKQIMAVTPWLGVLITSSVHMQACDPTAKVSQLLTISRSPDFTILKCKSNIRLYSLIDMSHHLSTIIMRDHSHVLDMYSGRQVVWELDVVTTFLC